MRQIGYFSVYIKWRFVWRFILNSKTFGFYRNQCLKSDFFSSCGGKGLCFFGDQLSEDKLRFYPQFMKGNNLIFFGDLLQINLRIVRVAVNCALVCLIFGHALKKENKTFEKR